MAVERGQTSSGTHTLRYSLADDGRGIKRIDLVYDQFFADDR